MKLGNLARMATVVAACVAAVGSASSSSQNQPQQPQGAQMNPPPAQDMDASRSIGLWKSTFGAVKIEADNAHGGLQSGALQGVWQYQRQGQDVVGYFYGTIRGNVLQFHWQEPANPPLTGEGYLVFEQTGRQYSGRWWSDKRDRVGDWNGWRNAAGGQPQYGQQPDGQNGQYGGQQYGYPRPQQPQQPATRNVGLSIAGILLAVVALGAGVVFIINLSQYLSIEEKWASEHFLSPEARRFGVSLIKRAAFERMTLFGPISAGLGVLGVVLTVLGLRKR